jgi:predicted dehydrogenase
MTKDGKIGIGIIGFGGIAQAVHAPGYRRLADQCEIVAIADIDPTRIEQAKSDKWNIPNAVEDYNKLLEMPEIDAVSICTPNGIHMQATLDALAAGKHVLCEKPMAMNATEAKTMIAKSEETGKKLQIGYNMRFSAGAQSLKRSIDAGMFGSVYHATARAMRRRGVPTWGVFINKELNGGGPLIDIGVHITDMTLWLMGHPKPVAVMGRAEAFIARRKDKPVVGMWGQWEPDKYTVEDFAAAMIRFEDGRTMHLTSSFVANIDREHFDTQIFGTDAGAFFDANTGQYNLYREEFGTLTDTTAGWQPNVQSTHGEEIRMFLKAIRENIPVKETGAATGEQGLMVTQIIDGIFKSSELGGKEVEIS